MTARRAIFKQSDLERALKVASAYGEVAGVRVEPTGAIEVLFANGSNTQQRNPLDRIL